VRFKNAVQATKGLAEAHRPGLQALAPADRRRISCQNTRTLAGSVNLDATLAQAQPNDTRWDYGVGLARNVGERAIWVEVHPASSLHIDEVIRKRRWLQRWLDTAPALAAITPKRAAAFLWVASGKVAFQKNSPQSRRLAEAGVSHPCEHLDLDKILVD
jgi:hypothetical protein